MVENGIYALHVSYYVLPTPISTSIKIQLVFYHSMEEKDIKLAFAS